MHDQHYRSAWQYLLAVQLHINRQCGLQRCAAIPTCRISLIAADADETHPKIAHGALEQLLSVRPDISSGKITDEDSVIALHLRKGGGEPGDTNQVDFNAGSAERGCQLLVLLRIS